MLFETIAMRTGIGLFDFSAANVLLASATKTIAETERTTITILIVVIGISQAPYSMVLTPNNAINYLVHNSAGLQARHEIDSISSRRRVFLHLSVFKSFQRSSGSRFFRIQKTCFAEELTHPSKWKGNFWITVSDAFCLLRSSLFRHLGSCEITTRGCSEETSKVFSIPRLAFACCFLTSQQTYSYMRQRLFEGCKNLRRQLWQLQSLKTIVG